MGVVVNMRHKTNNTQYNLIEKLELVNCQHLAKKIFERCDIGIRFLYSNISQKHYNSIVNLGIKLTEDQKSYWGHPIECMGLTENYEKNPKPRLLESNISAQLEVLRSADETIEPHSHIRTAYRFGNTCDFPPFSFVGFLVDCGAYTNLAIEASEGNTIFM